jgi:phosphomannomutase
LKYTDNFNGWLGKTAKDFTYPSIHEVLLGLIKYYKDNGSPGQKIIIGYDSRFLAKEFADFAACIMASNGIKVFLSNRIVPSSVLAFSVLHKKSLGSLVFTGDDLDAKYIGLRAYDSRGHFLKAEDLGITENKKKKDIETSEFSTRKWINKGFIEPFDPSICYENHIETQINFEAISPNVNKILFNPLFGSGIYYYDRLLSKNNIHGYTVDNDAVSDFKNIIPNPSLHKEQLYQDMIFKNADLGFIVSPDCTSFKFIVGPKVLTVEEVVALLLEKISGTSSNVDVIISDGIEINPKIISRSKLNFIRTTQQDFLSTIQNQDYLLAVDHFGRVYFEYHGIPDALMVGSHLMELLNNKEMTPALMHRKLEEINNFN